MPKGAKQTHVKSARRGRKAMKKVSAKGAYNKGVKKQMMLRRAPLVETKDRTASDIALRNGFAIREQTLNQAEPACNDWLTDGAPQQPLNWRQIANDDAFTNVSLNAFLRMPKGLRNGEMIGDSITAKWLNTRLEVRFPQGEIYQKQPDVTPTIRHRNMMIQKNAKVYAIWGWVTKPASFPLETNDHVNLPTVASAVTQAILDNYIVNQVKPYFDDDIDKLSFRPRETMNVKIEKYVRLKPNLDNAIATQATPVTSTHPSPNSIMEATGSIPNVYRSHSFDINRKILYTEGEQPADPGPALDYENNFVNDSWLPFLIIYNPQFADMKNVEKQTSGTKDPPGRSEFDPIDERRTQHMFYRFNNQLVYTDS